MEKFHTQKIKGATINRHNRTQTRFTDQLRVNLPRIRAGRKMKMQLKIRPRSPLDNLPLLRGAAPQNRNIVADPFLVSVVPGPLISVHQLLVGLPPAKSLIPGYVVRAPNNQSAGDNIVVTRPDIEDGRGKGVLAAATAAEVTTPHPTRIAWGGRSMSPSYSAPLPEGSASSAENLWRTSALQQKRSHTPEAGPQGDPSKSTRDAPGRPQPPPAPTPSLASPSEAAAHAAHPTTGEHHGGEHNHDPNHQV